MIPPRGPPSVLCVVDVVTSAICTGNTCVLKPSEYTPSSLYRFVELLREAGLPDGVVNLVNGRGEVTGSALVEHPGVDRIAFTGGTCLNLQFTRRAEG